MCHQFRGGDWLPKMDDVDNRVLSSSADLRQNDRHHNVNNQLSVEGVAMASQRIQQNNNDESSRPERYHKAMTVL